MRGELCTPTSSQVPCPGRMGSGAVREALAPALTLCLLPSIGHLQLCDTQGVPHNITIMDRGVWYVNDWSKQGWADPEERPRK